MNIDQLAEALDKIQEEELSQSGSEKCDTGDGITATSAEDNDEIHQTVLEIFKKCPVNFRFTLGSLFSAASLDATIYEIDNVGDLRAKIDEIASANKRPVSMSSEDARKILGYGIREEVHSGVNYTVYYPEGSVSASRGTPIYIPQKEKVVDTFPLTLFSACRKLAGDYGIEDVLSLSDDMDCYASAGKGGKYRETIVVKADSHGDLACQASDNRAVYDLDGVRVVHLGTDAGTKSYFLRGQVADYFRTSNLYVDPKGPHKLGNGIVASGPFDPTSFNGDVPDSTPETLTTVIGLLKVNKNQFTKRYNSFVKTLQPENLPAGPKTLSPPPGFEAAGAYPGKPEFLATPMGGRRDSTRSNNPRGGKSSRIWTTTMRESQGRGGGKAGDDVFRGRDNRQAAKPNWSNPEEKAVAGLMWLRNKSGCQLSTLEARFPDVHSHAHDVQATVGNGTRRTGLLNFVRTITRSKHMTIQAAADDASEGGHLPSVSLKGENGEEFEASHTYVFVLSLLKVCASLKFVSKEGLESVFYWDTTL